MAEENNTVNYLDLITTVYQNLKENEVKLKKDDVKSVIETLMDVVVDEVLEGKKRVYVTGLGIFFPKEVNRTTYRNPKTGESVEGKPFTKLGFKVNKKLRT